MPKEESNYRDIIKERKKSRADGIVAQVVTQVQQALGLFDTPDPARVWGMDISHWTGVVDMELAKAAGCAFVLIKYMDGKIRTRFAHENYKGAKDAGMIVGSWHWLHSLKENPRYYSPGGQAREYVAMLKDYPVDIPQPFVDFEKSPRGKKYNPDARDFQSYRSVFEDTYGGILGVYSGWGMWNEYGTPWDVTLKQSLWWQARYKATQPLSVAPWGMHWDFWQWTENGDGVKYGCPRDGERAVDLNYWRGTMAELNALCGIVS